MTLAPPEDTEMTQPPNKHPVSDFVGVIVAVAFVGMILGSLVGMYWIVFCHPGSRMKELIPFLRPARITVTAILAMSCYQFMARKAPQPRPRSRKVELLWTLVAVTILGAVRFFFGTGDGSTVADVNLETQVRWSQCLGIVMPLAALAILGYQKGKRQDEFDLAGYEALDGSPSPVVPPPSKPFRQKLREIFQILMS